jgi:hypothetical protein
MQMVYSLTRTKIHFKLILYIIFYKYLKNIFYARVGVRDVPGRTFTKSAPKIRSIVDAPEVRARARDAKSPGIKLYLLLPNLAS